MDSYLTSPDAETGYEMKDEDHWWSAEQQELGRMQWDQMTGFPTTNFSAWDTAAFGHGRAPSFLDESHGNDNGHEVNDIDPTRRLTGYAPTIGLDAIYDCRGAGSMVHAPRTLDTDTTPACPEEESEEVSGGGADDGTKSTKGATNDTWSESELREIELLQMDLSRFEAGSLPQTIKDWAGDRDIPTWYDRRIGKMVNFSFLDLCPGAHRQIIGLCKPRDNKWSDLTGIPSLNSRCAQNKACRSAMKQKIPILDKLISQAHRQDWQNHKKSKPPEVTFEVK